MVTVVKMRREYCVINVLQFSKFFVTSFVEPAPSVFMTIWAILTQADDEHSDWPGPEPGLSVMQLTDEEIDPEISFSQVLSLSFFQNVTALVLYLKNSKIIILLKNIPHGLPCEKIFEFRIFTLQLLAGPPPRKSQGRPVRSGTRRLKNQATAGKLFRTIAFVFDYLFNLISE